MDAREQRLLDGIKRRIYTTAVVLAVPVMVLVLIVRWDVEVPLRWAYSLLLVVLVVLGAGIWTRRISLAAAERTIVTVVLSLWFVRLLVALYGDGTLDEARRIVTESIGPGLMVMVVVVYLATEARVGARISLAIVGAFGLAVLPRVVMAFRAGEAGDVDLGLAMLRMGVYVAAVTGLVYSLAFLKERYAEVTARSAALDMLASTDPLTGMANRRRIQLVLENAVARSGRYRRDVAVILLDLDGFKSLNDTRGHAAGDDALQTVASVLQTHLRDVDVLGRWGGDELVVVLPETDLAAATLTAQRLCRLVSEQEIDTGDGVLSASVGVCCFHSGDDAEGMLQRADEAMYHAKSQGGATVVVHRGDGSLLTVGP